MLGVTAAAYCRVISVLPLQQTQLHRKVQQQQTAVQTDMPSLPQLLRRTLHKPGYTANYLHPINAILTCSYQTPQIIRVQDEVMLGHRTQRLKRYICYDQQAYALFVQTLGHRFEHSPQERRTELPLMILTDTRSIFERRIRRLRKLQKDQYSSQGTSSGTDISFSKSYMARSSCVYLESRLSQKNISELSDFRSSYFSWFDENEYNVFGQPSQTEGLSVGRAEAQIKEWRTKAMEKVRLWMRQIDGYQSRGGIVEQKDLGHLIVGEPCYAMNEANKGRWDDGSRETETETSQRTGKYERYKVGHYLRDEIREGVEAQRRRLNIVRPYIRGDGIGSRQSVLEKAQEWLSRMV